jgi:hypothetical protein
MVGFAASVSSARAVQAQNPAEALPLIGLGTGGIAFSRQCPSGQVLTGVRARIGLIIDALGIKCRPVNANGSLGGENDIGTLAGGSGGVGSAGSCPQGSVVVGQSGTPAPITGLSVFTLRCNRWDSAARRWTSTVAGSIRLISGSGAPVGLQVLVGSSAPAGPVCSRQTQPVVLIRGRAGTLIDAAGLTCNEP